MSNLLLESLQYQLGPEIAAALDNPRVVEIMVNPDGTIWTDEIGKGRQPTGARLDYAAADTAIRLIASHARVNVDKRNPLVSATLPGGGERFQGTYPPVTKAPAFAIRKKPAKVFPLESYVERGALTKRGAEFIRNAVAARENIMIAGGTGSGKTTFSNAVLNLDEFKSDRVAIIEDTPELQCNAADQLPMLTQMKDESNPITMRHLVQASLRLRPDRIIIGEVRDSSALELLKAWNTGHPGGIATIHANSAREALQRLEELISEATPTVPHRSIGSAINLIVFLARGEGGEVDDGKPQVKEIIRVSGYDTEQGYKLAPAL